MRINRKLGLLVLVCGLMIGGSNLSVAARPDHAAKNIRSLAIKWLVKHQDPKDGSYGKHDGLVTGRTALVVWVMATCQRQYQVVDGPYMSEAVDFILRHYQRDGSFGKNQSWKVTRFNTSMSILALSSLKTRRKYRKYIARALTFLVNSIPDDSPTTLNGLASIWPQNPGPVARLMLRAILEVQLGKGGAWIGKYVAAGQKLQNVKDDTTDDYGKCSGKILGGFEDDPVVVTAMVAKIADLVKANYKKLATSANAITKGKNKQKETK